MSLESVEAQPGKYSAHQKPQHRASSKNTTANTRPDGHVAAEAPHTARTRAKRSEAEEGAGALRTAHLPGGGALVEPGKARGSLDDVEPVRANLIGGIGARPHDGGSQVIEHEGRPRIDPFVKRDAPRTIANQGKVGHARGYGGGKAGRLGFDDGSTNLRFP